MFFTSGLIIAFFCFAFYLIWDQFLKKDSRLSTGLQVLRKKMNELSDLSQQVDRHIHQQISVVEKQTQELQSLITKAQQVHGQLKKSLTSSLPQDPDISSPSQKSTPLSSPSPPTPPSPENKNKALFQFGQSPFAKMDFDSSSQAEDSYEKEKSSSPNTSPSI